MTHLSPQNFLPSAGTQLQSGCAHLAFVFIEASFFSVLFINQDKCNVAVQRTCRTYRASVFRPGTHFSERITPVVRKICSILLIMGSYRRVQFNGIVAKLAYLHGLGGMRADFY